MRMLSFARIDLNKTVNASRNEYGTPFGSLMYHPTLNVKLSRVCRVAKSSRNNSHRRNSRSAFCAQGNLFVLFILKSERADYFAVSQTRNDSCRSLGGSIYGVARGIPGRAGARARARENERERE